MIGCEDQIDVDLDEADVLTTVDAFINTGADLQTIRLTETQNYFNSASANPILGASVLVTEEGGNTFTFEDQGNGDYTWAGNGSQLIGELSKTINLEINYGDQKIISSVEIGRSPVIEEIRQEDRDDIFGEGKYLEFIARDFEGYGDTYWIKSFRNGNYLNLPAEINIAWDATFDSGAETDGLIFIPPIRELINPLDSIGSTPWETGDVCRVEIHSLTPAVFNFMETVRDQLINGDNGIFAEPLINAKGNLEDIGTNKRVLGAFCVSEITSLEKIVD